MSLTYADVWRMLTYADGVTSLTDSHGIAILVFAAFKCNLKKKSIDFH
jgi:hypothetical protein